MFSDTSEFLQWKHISKCWHIRNLNQTNVWISLFNIYTKRTINNLRTYIVNRGNWFIHIFFLHITTPTKKPFSTQAPTKENQSIPYSCHSTNQYQRPKGWEHLWHSTNRHHILSCSRPNWHYPTQNLPIYKIKIVNALEKIHFFLLNIIHDR